MYTEADRIAVQKQLRSRWMVTAIPAVIMLMTGIVVFVICQGNRQDWGWIFACTMTILGGGYFLFLFGVYLSPLQMYAKHITYMLTGRQRETEGILTDISDVPVNKDGLDWYAMTVNIGSKGVPEDDRLLYYDALKGHPDISVGARIRAFSNDKMISAIHRIKAEDA